MKLIIIICACIYLFRLLFMLAGSIFENYKVGKLRKTLGDDKQSVSVIVPARNEENVIEECIESIANSNYPKDKFEIIAVNDRSTDNTQEKLDLLKKHIPNLKVFQVDENINHSNLKGKQGALNYGIKQSQNDLILFTDADCVVPPDWIQIISQLYNSPNIGLVSSYTMVEGSKLFDKIQSLEWILLCAMASAGIGFGIPLGCYGNNLSVRKKNYEEIGGYESLKFTTNEDLSLLLNIHRAGHSVHYVCDIGSCIKTKPVHSFSDYISQHKRWSFGGLELGWIAPMFVITTLSIWVGFLFSLIIGNIPLAIGFLILRLLGDAVILFQPLFKLKQHKLIKYMPIALVFFMLFELILPIFLLDPKITWKDQTFKRNGKKN
ncbi:MAG: glycosyltransferase [Candidatus Kapabacteria bacterium]|nr:glycosyltransferase [Candidatus Kapabacteria bacterium]